MIESTLSVIEYVTVLGIEYTMDDARKLWYALGEIFGINTTEGFWNIIPEEDRRKTMALFCPCKDCGLFQAA